MNDVSMAGAGNIERHEIENQRRGFWSAINALASLPIRSVQVMPDLARPVADPRISRRMLQVGFQVRRQCGFGHGIV